MDLVKNNEYIPLNKAFGVEEFGKKLEEAMKRETSYAKKKSFAPSGLGYKGACPRYWYYAFNGADFEYENDGPSISNMNAGTAAGERLANLLQDAGLLVDAERKAILKDPPIFGYIDAVVEWRGEQIPCEVKTTTDAAWNSRFLGNKVPGYQLIQLLLYMHTMGVDKGFFLTENKDTNQIYILPIKMTDENKKLVESVLDWMRMVKDNADNGQLPTRPFTKSSMQCKGCPLKTKCWEGWKRGSVNGADPNPGEITITPLGLPK